MANTIWTGFCSSGRPPKTSGRQLANFLYADCRIGETNMIRYIGLAGLILALGACASGSAVRTSQNTALIQASAAPVCGGSGAAQVAQKQAAIETIRAGYDRYVIASGQSQNNVRVTQVPGTSYTRGNVFGNSWNATTTYTPQTVVSGRHEQSFSIVMFRRGDPGYYSAISAKETLGADWAKIVDEGVMTCG